MRTSRLRDWLFGAKQALKRDPAVEDRLAALDKFIAETRMGLSELMDLVPAGTTSGATDAKIEKALEVIEAYGEGVRELMTGDVYPGGIPTYPYFKRALL